MLINSQVLRVTSWISMGSHCCRSHNTQYFSINYKFHLVIIIRRHWYYLRHPAIYLKTEPARDRDLGGYRREEENTIERSFCPRPIVRCLPMKVFLNTKLCEAGALSLCSTEDTETQISSVTCPAAEPSQSKSTWLSYLQSVLLFWPVCYTPVLSWLSTPSMIQVWDLSIVWLNA